MIYLIVQTPPPVHGVSLMNRYLINYLSKQNNIEFYVEKINASKHINSIGKFNFTKIANFFRIVINMFKKRKKIDTVYIIYSVNGFAFYRDFLIILFSKILGKRNILHLRVKGFSKLKGIKLYLTKIIMRKSYIIQHSKLLSYDTDLFDFQQRFFVPNGWEDNYEQYLNYKIQNKKTIDIIFFSNLMITKGLFVTLKAVNEIKEVFDKNNCKIHFLGNWENDIVKKDFFNFLNESDVKRYIGHIGPLYDAEKYKFLINMDIVLFPTYYPLETWGNVVLESMMFEKAIISTPEGSIPEMIENNYNGFLVPQKNSKELAKKLEILIKDDKKREIFGKNAREIFLKKFTIDVFENKMLDVFCKIENCNKKKKD